MIKIYILIDPENSYPFYVGATTVDLKERLSGHLTSYNYIGVKNSYVKDRSDLIFELKKACLKPDILLIKEVAIQDVDYYEKYYYNLFSSNGFKLIQDSSKFTYGKSRIKNNLRWA